MQQITEDSVVARVSEGMPTDRSVVALAHRVQLYKSGWPTTYVNMLVESAIRDASLASGAVRESIPDIVLSVNRSSGVSLFKAEVKDAIARLEKVGKVSRSDDGFLRIAPNEAARLAKISSEWTLLENRVRDEWLLSLSQRYPEYARSDLEILWAPLRQEFLSQILARNGEDTYRLLSGSHPRREIPATDGFSYNEILSKTIASLPQKYQALAKTEFPAFVRAGGDRGQYLTGLVANAFNTLSLALPKAVLQEMYGQQERVLTLLLDTNFIFSAFGLHSNPFNDAAQDILQIIQRIRDESDGKLVIDMRCDPSTVEEFRAGLKSRARDMGGQVFDVETAAVLAKSSNVPTLERSYCQAIVDGGVSITMDDFVRPYLESTSKLLAKKGIQVTEYKLPRSGPAYEEIKNDENEWYQIVIERDRFNGYNPIKHDVSLWHRARRLQPDLLPIEQTDFFARQAYLLTCDWHMISFNQRKARERNTDELVCILPSTFLQALTLFIPRTEDYSAALLQSLRMPISNGDARATEDAMRQILRVIVTYKPLGGIAVEALTNQALMDAVKNVENQDEVKDLVESSLAQALARAKEELSIAKQQASVAPQAPPTVGHVANVDDEEMRQLHKQIGELMAANEEGNKRNRELMAANADEKKRTDALEATDRAKALEAANRKHIQSTILTFLGATTLSALCGVVCYLLLRAYVSLPWITEPLKMTIAPTCALLLFGILVRKYEKLLKALEWIVAIGGTAQILFGIANWLVSRK